MKCFKNDIKQKVSLIKVVILISCSSINEKFGMIRMIFDIENWLWKSEFCDLHGQISNRLLICQRPFTVKSAIYHWVKLAFEGQVAKILKWYRIGMSSHSSGNLRIRRILKYIQILFNMCFLFLRKKISYWSTKKMLINKTQL